MIKYTVKKIPYVSGFLMCNYEYLKISRKDLNNYLNDGWEIEKKEYFIVSDVIRFWNLYNRDKKKDIVLFFLGIVSGWLLSKI